jgi:hypothetical protein
MHSVPTLVRSAASTSYILVPSRTLAFRQNLHTGRFQSPSIRRPRLPFVFMTLPNPFPASLLFSHPYKTLGVSPSGSARRVSRLPHLALVTTHKSSRITTLCRSGKSQLVCNQTNPNFFSECTLIGPSDALDLSARRTTWTRPAHPTIIASRRRFQVHG